MNAYNPTRPLLRAVFAAVALSVTIGLAAFIDGLAYSYTDAGQQASIAKSVVVASAQR